MTQALTSFPFEIEAVAPPAPQVLNGADFSTYRIGGKLLEAYVPTSINQAVSLLESLKPRFEAGESLTTLGWGSNTLVSSNGISTPTLITRKITDLTGGPEHSLFIGAGVHLAQVAHLTQQWGVTGGEFLIGIPGTMGGAVVMNGGAMGQETADIAKKVLAWHWPSQCLKVLERKDLHFSYRQSNLCPQEWLVLAVQCQFQPGNPEESKARMEKNMAFRKAHHPTEPNGGSVFRNPEDGEPVGLMLDKLGARGVWHEGDARISPKHGNFIINADQASSTEVLRLMRRMQEAVLKEFGHKIYPENRFLGDFSEEETVLWQALKEGDPHGNP